MMTDNDVVRLARPNILALKPYSCARDEFKGEAKAFLDANENSRMAPYNRYPDPLNLDLKERIARSIGGGMVTADNIFLGVGSDECIDMVYRVFCRPGIDNVVAIDPTYGMYSVCAEVNDVQYRRVPLNDDFSLDIGRLLAATDASTKAVWVCSPNNPTGNAFPTALIERLAGSFNGLVIVDEAYGDFSGHGSMIGLIGRYPNLVVMRTFSKAWGSAAIRLGMAFASKAVVALFNKVKYPYNINRLSSDRAMELLDDPQAIARLAAEIVAARDVLAARLAGSAVVRRVYPSDANFLLVKVDDADGLYAYLSSRGIVTRNRSTVNLCGSTLRVTVGTDDENDLLISAINDYASQR
jgi:histidinol-phosphate aminotransferase